MSTVDEAIPISRTKLLVVVAVLLLISGAGAGPLSNALSESESQPSPPGAGEDSAPNATIDVAASDPPNVRDAEGDAGRVAGELDGTLEVDSGVDRVEFVVWSRLPNGSWAVTDRATVESVPAGRVDLGDVVGGPNTTYLSDARSEGFDVETPGSTARREGFVSVTARLYVDGDRRVAVTDTDGYAFLVDRPAARTTDARDGSSDADGSGAESGQIIEVGPTDGDEGSDDGTDGSDAPAESEPTDDPNRETVLFGAEGVLPGSSGASSARLSNPTDEPVTADLAVGAPIDEENGLTEPEADVDDTPDVGELSEHLDVRVFVERADGDRTYLVGDGDEYVPIADAAEATEPLDLAPNETVTVVVEWQVDGAVGNEIQSDGATLTVHCAFESSDALLPRFSLR